MIGAGTLYLRYTRTDPRLKPSWLWDVALVVSVGGLLLAGLWGAWPGLIAPLLRAVGLVACLTAW
jgi:hypothetical protein